MLRKDNWAYDEDVATYSMILANQAQQRWQMTARPIGIHVLNHASLILSIT